MDTFPKVKLPLHPVARSEPVSELPPRRAHPLPIQPQEHDRLLAYADIAVGYHKRLPELEQTMARVEGVSMTAASYAQRCNEKIDILLAAMKIPSVPPPPDPKHGGPVRRDSPMPDVYVQKIKTGEWEKMTKEDAERYMAVQARMMADEMLIKKQLDEREMATAAAQWRALTGGTRALIFKVAAGVIVGVTLVLATSYGIGNCGHAKAAATLHAATH